MYGAYTYPNPAISSSQCWETSHFAGYKNNDACFLTFANSKSQNVHDITCIDNVIGMSLTSGGMERDEVFVTVEDSHFYGETEADDCPSTSQCFCVPKYQFMSVQNMNDMKDLMPTGASALPIWGSHGEGNWGGSIYIKNSNFNNFMGKSKCGERSVIFERNPNGSDKIPIHHFERCKFTNVDDLGFAFLDKPNEAWANIKDCGNFPCTAPNNFIMTFTDTRYD